jgi:hypothetical protein
LAGKIRGARPPKIRSSGRFRLLERSLAKLVRRGLGDPRLSRPPAPRRRRCLEQVGAASSSLAPTAIFGPGGGGTAVHPDGGTVAFATANDWVLDSLFRIREARCLSLAACQAVLTGRTDVRTESRVRVAPLSGGLRGASWRDGLLDEAGWREKPRTCRIFIVAAVRRRKHERGTRDDCRTDFHTGMAVHHDLSRSFLHVSLGGHRHARGMPHSHAGMCLALRTTHGLHDAEQMLRVPPWLRTSLWVRSE